MYYSSRKVSNMFFESVVEYLCKLGNASRGNFNFFFLGLTIFRYGREKYSVFGGEGAWVAEGG